MTSRLHRPIRLWSGFLLILIVGAAVLAARLSADPAAAIRYVSPSGHDGGGSNLCLDPAAPCSTLARALVVAQANDAIHLSSGEYNEAGLIVDKAIAIRGEDAATTRLDGHGRDTLLTITSSGALTLEGVTLRGGAGRRGGGARAEAGSQLTLRRVTLEGNVADQGGAIYTVGSGLSIEASRLENNSAGVGGALYVGAGTFTMDSSEVSGNTAGAGGGLFIGPDALASLRAVTFTDNRAATVGGGLYVQSGTMTMANVVLRTNWAGGRGGGLFNDGGAVDSAYSTWLTNESPVGSAVAQTGGQTYLGYSILRGSDLCAGPVTTVGVLADNAGCGAPAEPATGLDADGRPAYGSNAIDAGPVGSCLSGGAALTDDRRGELRPAGNGEGAPRCDIGAFEFQPRITIRHVPNLSDGTHFGYGGDLGDFTLTAGERPRAVFEAAPGAWRFSQTQEPGWKLNAITCTGDQDGGSLIDLPARAVTIDLDAGESISCVFSVRSNRDTIGVNVRGPMETDPVVAFEGDLGAFELQLAGADNMHSGRLDPGFYTINATPPAGWRVTAIACAGDTDGGTTTDPVAGQAVVDLDNRESIGCSFTLAPNNPTTLIIRHEVTPAGAAAGASFVYSGDLGLFALQPEDQPARTFALPAGLYSLHEILHPSWALSQLSCAGDLDEGSVLAPEEATARIDLDEGEAISCIFGHVPATSGRGTILIEHAPTPPDDTNFAFNGTLGEFLLSSPGSPTRTFAQLTPGSYTVRQLTPAGWISSGIVCEGDADNGTTLLLPEATAIIDLDEDETIHCVFGAARPAQTGAITIVHEPTPADETQFRYNGTLGGFNLRAPSRPNRAFVDLTPGSYTVGARPQDGWTLLGITCDGDNDGGSVINGPTRQVTIDLDAGEAIVCRFAHAGPGVTVTPPPSPTPPPPTATPPPGPGATTYLPIIR